MQVNIIETLSIVGLEYFLTDDSIVASYGGLVFDDETNRVLATQEFLDTCAPEFLAAAIAHEHGHMSYAHTTTQSEDPAQSSRIEGEADAFAIRASGLAVADYYERLTALSATLIARIHGVPELPEEVMEILLTAGAARRAVAEELV